MRVIEIFYSIDGEGKRAGQPCTFIRLAGCNLACVYCDTPYSHDTMAGDIMSIEDIITACKDIGCPNITVTGGEPLIHPGIHALLSGLGDLGYSLNIETNGSISTLGIVDRLMYPNIFFTIDYKCPSSGMEKQMCSFNFDNLWKEDVLKFVVGDSEDLEKALSVINKFKPACQIYFSPIWGEIDMTDIVEFMKINKLYNAKIQVQLHKIIWDPNKRGV